MSGVESGVTQADREAAAALHYEYKIGSMSWFHASGERDNILAGKHDNHRGVQAFAAHRQAAYAAGVAAERERCAGIADKVAAEFPNITKDSGPAIGAVTIAVHIAAQIRAAIAATGGE